MPGPAAMLFLVAIAALVAATAALLAATAALLSIHRKEKP